MTEELKTIKCVYGSTKTITLNVTSNDAPVDITGYTFLFTVKRTYDTNDTDEDAIIRKAFSITNAEGGVATLSLATTDTKFKPDTYKYNIKYINSNSTQVVPFRNGTFILYPSTTNRVEQ
jgi:hypothetical protein